MSVSSSAEVPSLSSLCGVVSAGQLVLPHQGDVYRCVKMKANGKGGIVCPYHSWVYDLKVVPQQ